MENNVEFQNNYYNVTGAIQGWQCPICKRIFGPFVQECLHCNSSQQTTRIWLSTTHLNENSLSKNGFIGDPLGPRTYYNTTSNIFTDSQSSVTHRGKHMKNKEEQNK